METVDYWEHDLPPFLQESLDRMKASWERYDRGEKDSLWDCYYCELQADINCCEVDRLITPEHAWYLREKFLRIERPGSIE